MRTKSQWRNYAAACLWTMRRCQREASEANQRCFAGDSSAVPLLADRMLAIGLYRGRAIAYKEASEDAS